MISVGRIEVTARSNNRGGGQGHVPMTNDRADSAPQRLLTAAPHRMLPVRTSPWYHQLVRKATPSLMR